MNVSLCENIKKSQITGYDTISGILEKIQKGETQLLTEHARSYGKHSVEYNKIKCQVPTFTPNASFNYKRELSQVKELSGFIYLDMDEFSDMDYLKQDNHIYSCWRSFSGVGIGALVQVSGITIQNFKQYWSNISDYFNHLGIRIDKQTGDITRQNVISYDPDIHVNKESIPFEIKSIKEQESQEINHFEYTLANMSSTALFNGFEENYNELTSITYSTSLTDYMGLDYIVIEEGKEFRSCFLPKEIKDGHRHKWIVGYTVSVLFNNPTLSMEKLYTNVLYSNNTHCFPPLPSSEIMSIVKWYHNTHTNGKLNYHPKIKKIWFNPYSDIPRIDKRKIIGTETGKLRRIATIKKLKSIYSELSLSNEKVTQKLVAYTSKLSIGTVKRYWAEIIV
jgi:hypothetical protein